MHNKIIAWMDSVEQEKPSVGLACLQEQDESARGSALLEVRVKVVWSHSYAEAK